MIFDRSKAKALSTNKELELFDYSRPPKLTKLTEKELRNMVKRSRTLRDRLRDIKKSQVRSTQARSTTRGAAPPDRSREKAELYSNVHDAFVARLEFVIARAEKEKAKESTRKLLALAAKSRQRNTVSSEARRSVKATATSKSAANPAVDTLQKPQTAARTPSTRGKIEQTRIARSGITQKRGHMASTNKRNQAKRDSKQR